MVYNIKGVQIINPFYFENTNKRDLTQDTLWRTKRRSQKGKREEGLPKRLGLDRARSKLAKK